MFCDVLNVSDQDKKIALIDNISTLLCAIENFTKVGAENRRYRTLVISASGKYLGVLSYLDVFNIFLAREYRNTIEGFLSQKIEHALENKKIVTLDEANSLETAIHTLDTNPFTHIPISCRGSQDVIGLVDEVIVRSLQYDVIYEYVEDMKLKEVLEIKRPNFKDMTVLPSETIEDALKKFVNSINRPKTLLIGEISNDCHTVSLNNTLSYVDVMRIFLKFANNQLKQASPDNIRG